MKKLNLIIIALFVIAAMSSCKKSKTTPVEPDPIVTPTPVIKQYNFQFLFQGGHNTAQDTLIIKYNDVVKTVNKTYFRVQTGDKISIYYNPGYYFAAVDSNKVKLTLDGVTFKTYNCACITNESIIIQ